MGAILITVVLVVGFIFLSLTALILFKLSKHRRRFDIMPNAPLINMTTRRKVTDGYTEGVVKSQTITKNNMTRFEVYPSDAEQGEDKPRPEMQTFMVANEFIDRMPIGDASSRREKILINSRDPTDIPGGMSKSDMAELMTVKGQLGWLKKTFKEAIPSGDEAIAEGNKWMARGQVSRDALAKMREETMHGIKLKSLEPEKKEEKK